MSTSNIIPSDTVAALTGVTETTSSQSSQPASTSSTQPTQPDDSPLFSTDLISPEVSSSLPTGYTIRPLHESDYTNNFLTVLSVLTTVGDISPDAFASQYAYMKSRNDEYFILVICDDAGKVVGTGALVVERKFIHALGKVGHIEDIAVSRDQQGKKLGLRIIQALGFVAEKVGCYKTILDCSEANEGFYIKCGYKRAGLQMAHYYYNPNPSKANA